MIQAPDFILYLVRAGVNVRLHDLTWRTNGLERGYFGIVYAIGGFYKHGEVFLTPAENPEDGWRVLGRYSELGTVSCLEDIVQMNAYEFRVWEDRGFTVDTAWMKLFETFNLVEVKEEIVRTVTFR